MKYAKLNIANPVWDTGQIFMVLRAVHYLAEFHQVTELRLNCTAPAQVQNDWQKSILRKKRMMNIVFDSATDDVPAFCFPDYKIQLNGKETVTLGIPEIPELTDFHVHTRLAYCSENMDVAKALELERLSGVKHVNFSEHSGQLYCIEHTYWNNLFHWSKRNAAEERTAEYRQLAQGNSMFGLELDVDEDAVVSDIQGIGGFRLGAVHFLGSELSFEEKKCDFMRRLDGLLGYGIDILAHPFRVFSKGGMPIPEDLFEPVAEKLVRADVAAEINFHTNRPQPEFVRLLLKKGGKISFGTDSHNLYEAGYLKPHYEFCKQLDIAGKLDSILFSAEGKKKR